MSTPVVFQYQQALDQFRREGREPPLLKRMSELISFLDLTATLNSTLSGKEILDAALLVVMGELDHHRAAAMLSRDLDASAPSLNTDGRLRIRDGRHPVLLETARRGGGEVVPLNLDLGTDATTVVMYETVQTVFARQQVARASAMTVVFFVAVLLVTWLQRRFLRQEREGS